MSAAVEPHALLQLLNRCPQNDHRWVELRNAAREDYLRCSLCSMIVWG